MKISDEILSAFLDKELSEQHMAEVRDAINADPQLSERLALLGTADKLVRQQASAIDAVPMPKEVLRLLQDKPGQETVPDNLVNFSAWKRSRQFFFEHAAMAASVILVTGFVAGSMLSRTFPGGGADNLVFATLDNIASGETVSISADTNLLSRFSFLDQQDRYCRQYQLRMSASVSENIACRAGSGWELVATARTSGVYQAEEYQPASGSNLLDSTLDAMMQGAALSLDEEAMLISSQWRTE